MSEAFHPEGSDIVSRRDFVKTLTAAALVSSSASAAPATAETPVARFYRSLNDEQKAQICFPFDHPLRFQVANNWAIVKPRIGDLNPEPRALCAEVFKTLCSADGHARFLRQMTDDSGGLDRYHVALFGKPGTDQPFECLFTGRHATFRADGHQPAGASFAGPIFYGHSAEDPAANVWHDQAALARAIFQTLTGDQQASALIPSGVRTEKGGLPVGTLDASQKAMVNNLLEDLLMPFHLPATETRSSLLLNPGGLDVLRLTYYAEGGVADVWKLEGPAFSWYFHGRPHVHAWFHRVKA